ncbi:hypothetical protein ScFU53_13660 [Streptococcus canis]|nr:uncharacterized protein TANIYAMA4_0010 [Streptococcus canis]GEE06439.1 hypothetical protein ScOT1_05320 [Streptococcus canis]GFE42735.1 hypothetical protein ScFU1_04170 [Streptococcus canis]GFE44761.1 hypothetical protein ScFU6_05300 [Streptococcus canis]GFE47293.1 hypothetical protein ScFU129_09240 [Streptococcus canis]
MKDNTGTRFLAFYFYRNLKRAQMTADNLRKSSPFGIWFVPKMRTNRIKELMCDEYDVVTNE